MFIVIKLTKKLLVVMVTVERDIGIIIGRNGIIFTGFWMTSFYVYGCTLGYSPLQTNTFKHHFQLA